MNVGNQPTIGRGLGVIMGSSVRMVGGFVAVVATVAGREAIVTGTRVDGGGGEVSEHVLTC
jgi:hypothetical protein